MNALLELIDHIEPELVVNFAAHAWWPAGQPPPLHHQRGRPGGTMHCVKNRFSNMFT